MPGYLVEDARKVTTHRLKEMKADGSLAAISEKWFGKDITVVP